MNIEPYTGYFHDGNLSSIVHDSNGLVFALESAEIEPEFDVDSSILSKDKTIKGKLCVKNSTEVIVDGKVFDGILLMIHDDGRILDLEIKGNQIYLLIEWWDFPLKPKTNDVTRIEITSDNFVWISDLL